MLSSEPTNWVQSRDPHGGSREPTLKAVLWASCMCYNMHTVQFCYFSYDLLTLTIQEMIETNDTMSINVHGQHGQRTSRILEDTFIYLKTTI